LFVVGHRGHHFFCGIDMHVLFVEGSDIRERELATLSWLMHRGLLPDAFVSQCVFEVVVEVQKTQPKDGVSNYPASIADLANEQ
jgi:hypothetical protein